MSDRFWHIFAILTVLGCLFIVGIWAFMVLSHVLIYLGVIQ